MIDVVTGSLESTTGGTFDVAVPLSAKTERREFNATAAGRFLRYNVGPELNRNEGKFDLSIRQLNELTVWSAAAGWTHDTTLTSELGTTGLTQINNRHDQYMASLSPEFQLSQRDFLSLGASGQWTRYADAAGTGLVDYHYGTASVTYTRRMGAVTQIGLGVQADRLSAPDLHSTDTTDGLVRFNVSHKWTERLSVNAFVGAFWARQQTLEYWGGAGQLALQYGGQRTDFSLAIGHQLAPAGFGALTVQSSATVAMTYRMTEKVSSVTTASYLRSSEALVAAAATGYGVYYWRLEEGVRWQFAETFSLALTAGETEQAVNTASGHANRFGASIALTWAPRQIML